MRPRYYQPRPGKYLHWPEYIAQPARDGGPTPLVPRKERIWAGPSDIVRVDNPFIERCLKGQEFKCDKLGSPGKGRVLQEESYPITVQRRLEAMRRKDKGLDTPTKEAKRIAHRVSTAPPQAELPGIDTGEAPDPKPAEADTEPTDG